MEVAEPIQFSRFVIRDKAAENNKETLILFSERGGASFSDVKASNKMTAVIGPKGGWDDSELDEASGSGFAIVTFGEEYLGPKRRRSHFRRSSSTVSATSTRSLTSPPSGGNRHRHAVSASLFRLGFG